MKSKTSSLVFLSTITSVILGGIFGYYLPEIMLSVSFIGQLFINALRIVVIPVVVVSIIIGIAGMGDIKKINRSVGKTILYFISTSAVAVCIGLILVYLIHPGGNLIIEGAYIPPETMQLKSFSFSGMIASLLPENLFQASFGGQMLGLIIFSIFFGVVLANSGTKRKIVIDFLQVINTSLSKLVVLILIIAPIGLFSLIGTITARNFSSISNIAGNLFIFSLTLIIAFLIHTFIILPVALKIFTNHSPFTYLKNSIPAISTALGTASSIATLPVTYDCVVEKNKIDNRAGALTLPLGAAINMNGTALYLVVATIFIAQVFQISLSPIQIILILGASLLVSVGSSVIPHASVITLAIIFNIADFPIGAYAGIGLIVAVDWFFDRWRTAVNVWSDTVGAAVIGNTFDFKTVRVSRTHSTGRTKVVNR
ncbi:MAG: dicarboxylate/amino acid:cation symporter, partial [Candidatus Zixiibacteriota bacterium]